MSDAPVMVDVETGEVVTIATAEQARNLTDRIKVAVEGTWLLVKEAYEVRAWVALGFRSWDEYCTREFGTSRLRLPREDREEVVSSLRASGMSIRAIAAATGSSPMTVQTDLRSSGVPKKHTSDSADVEDNELPVPKPAVIGTDGKTYPASTSPGVEAARARRAAEAAAKESTVGSGIKGVRNDHHSAEALRETIVDLAGQGYTGQQIADSLGKNATYIRARAREFGVEIPADAIVANSRRLDPNRIVNEMATTLEGLRRQTGNAKGHCVAAAAVEIINTGRGGKKLPSWWKAGA